ncbi:MAG: divergent polysaccharide deacetylase family protein, partial [Pseudomonadota bacterium]
KRESTLRALSLPPEVTLSFLPFGIHTAELSERARDQGHELFLHLPMEPLSRQHNPGPDALLVRDDMITLSEKIDRNLSRFDNYAAINSHMGSRFSVWEPGVRRLMEILHNRGIGFIDSYTTHRSVAYTIADELGVPAFRRDVFLDNDPQPEKILESIAKLTEIAGKRGYALAIAHPHPTTVQVLNAWITSPGFALRHQLVPASQLLGLDIALPDNTASGLSSAGKN